jgi:hypothetical protein
MTAEHLILIGAGVLLLGALVYLVAAFLVKRVTYLPDGTRIVYYPLAPGMWVEEGPQILHRTQEEVIDRNEQIRRHLEGVRNGRGSLKRVAPRNPNGPVKPRLRRLIVKGARGLQNSLR